MSNKKNKLVDVERIRKLCNEKGVTFTVLANVLGGATRQSVSKKLQNLATISADELFIIADELGVAPSELRLRLTTHS